MTESIKIQPTRYRKDDRSYTTAFDMPDTAIGGDWGSEAIRFEVVTSHWPDHKSYSSRINRMTVQRDALGRIESTMLRSLIQGEKSPLGPVITKTARFSASKLQELHVDFLVAVQDADTLEALIAWAKREREVGA